MKRIAVLGMVVLLLLSIFTGCSSDSGPKNMTFVENNQGREFTIYDNLDFTARIPSAYLFSVINPGSDVSDITGITSVSGKISGASGNWTSSPLTGMAGNLSSSNPLVGEMLRGTDPVSIIMTYTISNDEITAVNIAFPGAATDLIAGMSQALMGGSYTRN